MSTGYTSVVSIAAARKRHRCSWCDTRIEVGEPYKRWRYFDDGDVGTIKMHPECHEAMEAAPNHLVDEGWMPGEFPRGCNCDHDPDCPKCRARAKAKNDAARF
jgi:hypothetical protein